MEPTERNDLFIPGYTRRTKPDIITSLLIMGQVVIGVALAAIAGPLFAHASTTHDMPAWWIGGTCLVTGVFLVIGGLTSRRKRIQRLLSSPEPSTDSQKAPRDPTMPMLGALLVYKYRVITESQLQRALEMQRKEKGNHKRLGELLLEMGLITEAQLRKALDYQQSQSRRFGSSSGRG
jgi:hypothetical protein